LGDRDSGSTARESRNVKNKFEGAGGELSGVRGKFWEFEGRWVRNELTGGFLDGGYTLDGSTENVAWVIDHLR
jgi:hypothetical protein